MVEELGHRVVAEACNIRDAQVLAETMVFDIAILDINIAGSSIAPVATIIARRELPFIFVSGYGLASRPEEFIERPALQKPVSISILGETINAILATAGKASSRADDSSPNIPQRPPRHHVYAAVWRDNLDENGAAIRMRNQQP